LEKHCAPAIRGHMKNFLSCIASREKPVADIEQGYISTTSCILANLSMQLGRSLAWDPASGRVLGDDEANRLLRRPYRAPWTHPEPANVGNDAEARSTRPSAELKTLSQVRQSLGGQQFSGFRQIPR